MTLDLRGTTALITGASSGLGVEFAAHYARRGAALVLVARRSDRLESVANEVRDRFGVDVTTISLDLSEAGAAVELHERLRESGIRISSLVNNAGFGTHGDLMSADGERLAEEIRLNVGALVALTHEFLPEIVGDAAASGRPGRATIVNVASTAAFQPTPGMAVYGATKAFVLSFTESLWAEARRSGVRVLALCPGPTRTEFFDVVGSEAAAVGRMQTAEQVVATAFCVLERRNGGPTVVSGVANHVTALASRLLTRRAVAIVSQKVLGGTYLAGARLAKGHSRASSPAATD